MKKIINCCTGICILVLAGCMSLEERLASKDYQTRKEAESELYSDAVRRGSEREVLDAVSRMTCEELLAAVAVSDSSAKITKAAVDKITEDKWLFAVVFHARNTEIQGAALVKMKDQTFLLEAYKSLKDEQLRVKAIERMAPESIVKIPYSPTLAPRWKDISNQSLLEKILSRDLAKVDEAEWGDLIAKITDESLKEKVQLDIAYIYAEQHGSLSDEARKVLLQNLTDKDIIEEMVTEPDKNEIRREEDRIRNGLKEIDEKIAKEKLEIERLRKWLKEDKRELSLHSRAKEYRARIKEHEMKLAQLQKEKVELKESAPRKIYVDDVTARIPLYEKLGDDVLMKMAKGKMKKLKKPFHADDIARWEECSELVARFKSVDCKVRYYGWFLSKIAQDEVSSNGKRIVFEGLGATSLYNHKWGTLDTTKAQLFVDTWKLEKDSELLKGLLTKDSKGCKYLMKYTSSDMLYALVKSGTLKQTENLIAAIKQIDTNLLDMTLYNVIKNDDVRAVMIKRMPASVSVEAEKVNAQGIENLIAKGREKNAETFSLKGFYLGMQIEDAKRLLRYYLPRSRIEITKDNNIEIDVKHDGDLDVTPMYFCRADRSGKVYLFNFDKKRFLSKWFDYDVQSYREWAAALGKEFNFDFRSREVKGKRDLGSVWIRVSQEVYQYRNTGKCYVASFFGEKDIFDPNGAVSLDSFMQDAHRAGMIEGLRAWVHSGWDNGAGAREGTLRVQAMQ